MSLNCWIPRFNHLPDIPQVLNSYLAAPAKLLITIFSLSNEMYCLIELKLYILIVTDAIVNAAIRPKSVIMITGK